MKRILICLWIVAGLVAGAAYAQPLFQAPHTYPVGGTSPWDIAVGHFNADSYLDLAAVGYNDGTNAFVGVLLGTGGGNFGSAATLSCAGSYPEHIATGDFNTDGYTDIVIPRQGTRDIRVWLATGSGGFGAPTDLFGGGGYFMGPMAIAVSDFDNNSQLDFAVTDRTWNLVQTFQGNGSGGFSDRDTKSGFNGPWAICSGLFNGDNNQDLAVVNYSGNTVSILLGQGNMFFGNRVDYDVGSNPCAVACGDFNQDGYTDIVTANRGSSNVSILLGTGTGSFGSPTNISAVSNPMGVAVADFDQDNHLDVAVCEGGSGGNIVILLGAGNGTFPTSDWYVSGVSSYITSIISGDFNSDGLPDLAMTNRDGNSISVLLSAMPSAQVTGVSASEDLCDGVMITWDDVADETSYKVYRDAVEVGTTDPNVTMFTDICAPGTYSYDVKAYNGAGDGPLSDPDEGTRLNCSFPYAEVDMGDLATCDYPTLVNNPAHGLSGVAWLGENITSEAAPNALDLDTGDDGVVFVELPWMPCSGEEKMVIVTVTEGPEYARYASLGGQLFLNAWKDGNLNGNFCDVLCEGTAPEWIIQNQPVVPGEQEFSLLDPGDSTLGHPRYDGIFRFRLTSSAVGSEGFGLMDNGACPTMTCGTFAADSVGEVEDYIMHDAQLSVELVSCVATAGDGAITLNWTTASEIQNDHFDIVRNGSLLVHVPGAGNASTETRYTWTDTEVINGTTYRYTLVSVAINGTQRELQTVSATPLSAPTAITDYALYQNYPNPFNAVTEIEYVLKETGLVYIRVFNVQGQTVATLVSGSMLQGHHRIAFDASALPSGLYMLHMETAGFVAQRKMVLLK
ncbi:MAG: FG-GAP-like repeat-containing protein [bacterium]|nr:FG-GAP-like repeat-containing protein [bacterium]